MKRALTTYIFASMNKIKFKKGDTVEDSWYPEAGRGIIQKVLKTRLKIYFERAKLDHFVSHLFRYAKENGIVTYDKPHYRFLKKHETN